MIKRLIFAGFVFFGSWGRGVPSGQGNVEGVMVEFTAAATLTQRNQLHKQYQTEIFYRSKHYKIDHVIWATPPKLGGGDLKELCHHYAQSPEVVACSINEWTDLKSLRPVKAPSPILDLEISCQNGRVSSPSPALEKQPTPHINSLPSLWAQWLMGFDLIDEDFKETAHLMGQKVAIVDGGFYPPWLEFPPTFQASKGPIQTFRSLASHAPVKVTPARLHGTQVAQLIGGKPPFGLGLFPSPISLYPAKTTSHYLQAFDHLTDYPAQVVNLSLELKAKDFEKRLHQAFLKKTGSLLVQARARVEKHTPSEGLLEIGSLNYQGYSKSFDASLVAPSSPFVAVKTGPEISLLEGASASAAFLTPTLAMSLSLYPLSRKELLRWVRLSSTPIFQNKQTTLLMINPYRLVSMAQLASKNPHPTLPDPTALLGVLKKQAATYFQQALSQMGSKKCDIQKKGWKNLRRAYLLDPTNLVHQESLRTMSILEGHAQMAEFF